MVLTLLTPYGVMNSTPNTVIRLAVGVWGFRSMEAAAWCGHATEKGAETFESF